MPEPENLPAGAPGALNAAVAVGGASPKAKAGPKGKSIKQPPAGVQAPPVPASGAGGFEVAVTMRATVIPLRKGEEKNVPNQTHWIKLGAYTFTHCGKNGAAPTVAEINRCLEALQEQQQAPNDYATAEDEDGE